ncbi:MAG TPA: PqqD family protein [Chloroflexota bacterium]|nr:PqqD family protein [Chloroflexota bacterium]
MAVSLRSAPLDGARVRRSDRVVERVVDGELVLYDTARHRVHVMNPTAAWIWRLCDGGHSPAAVVSALVSRYSGVDRATVEADVGEILARFRVEGLLDE